MVTFAASAVRLTELRSRSFLVRYATLFGGEIFAKICLLLAFAYLARILEPADYGLVELALSITVFFILGVESGMGAFGARVAATEPDRLPQLVPRVMLLRWLLGLPAYLALLWVASSVNAALGSLLMITGATMVLTPLLTQWVFQGLRQMQWVAWGSALRNVTFAALVFLLVRRGADLRLVALSEIAGVAALGIFNSVLLFGRLRLRPDFRGLVSGSRQVLSSVWALGLSDFTWACLWYSPAVIAGWTSGGSTQEVAWIGAAVRLVISLHTFVWLYFFNLLPNLAKELATGLDQWRVLVVRSLRLAMWPAAFVAIGGTIIAPALMPAVYGESYSSAVLPLQIVIWMIPIAWFSGHFRFSLIAGGHQEWELGALIAGAFVTAIAAAVFSMKSGSVGAAVGLTAGGAANAIAAVWASGRRIGHVGALAELLPVAAATVTSLLIGLTLSRWWGPMAGATGGCLVFAALAARFQPALLATVRERMR